MYHKGRERWLYPPFISLWIAGKRGYTIRVTAFYFLCEREIEGVIPGSPKIRIHPGSGLRSGWCEIKTMDCVCYIRNLALPRDGTAVQRMRVFRKCSYCARGNALVNISAICCFVEICSMVMVLLTTCERKWWSRTDKCLVRGRVLWLVAISIQLLLSSKVRHSTRGVGE